MSLAGTPLLVRHLARLLLLALAALAVLLGGSRAASAGPADPVFVGAGDISTCASNDDETTAALLDGIAGTVFTLGDNAYETGTATEFTNCYGPTWGRHKSRTKPAPGNHDYYTPNATGYYGYFGAAAGDPAKGYYSYDLGAWHIVVINSNCDPAGVIVPCNSGSAQQQWLRADLAAHPTACTLAYWHHPRFSSGSTHGNSAYMEPVWQALYDYGADVVLSGHEHNYERFAKQTPGGAADSAHGIREFVVGTGGKSHYGFGAPKPNSELREGNTYGVLQLTLHPSGYDWQFVPVAGQTFTDSGSDSCHAAPAGVGGVTALADRPSGGQQSERWWLIAAGAVALVVAAGSLVAARRLRG